MGNEVISHIAGEAEHVLVAVRDDDGASPFDSVIKAAAHETKLKNWMHKTSEEKALSKMVDVLDRVGPATLSDKLLLFCNRVAG